VTWYDSLVIIIRLSCFKQPSSCCRSPEIYWLRFYFVVYCLAWFKKPRKSVWHFKVFWRIFRQNMLPNTGQNCL
jgi:hypothetical protein